MGALDGKHIIITGASSGFGEATAIACAAEGANVTLVARREGELQRVADLARAAGGQALVCPADVRDDARIYEIVAEARAAFGAVDVLFNNAGTNMAQRSISETTPENFRWLMDVNLTSAFVFTRAVLDEMMARGDGLIINLASPRRHVPQSWRGRHLQRVKIGMDALTRVTNEEGNPHGVRACWFNPGFGNTPIIDKRPNPLQPRAESAHDPARGHCRYSRLPVQAASQCQSRPDFHAADLPIGSAK